MIDRADRLTDRYIWKVAESCSWIDGRGELWIDPYGHLHPIGRLNHHAWAEKYVAEKGIRVPPGKLESEVLLENRWVRQVSLLLYEARRTPTPETNRAIAKWIEGCLEKMSPEERRQLRAHRTVLMITPAGYRGPLLQFLDDHGAGAPPDMWKIARYKKKKVVKTKDGDERTVYIYSDRQVAERNRAKAEKVEHLRKQIDKLRKQVQKDLSSKDEHTRATALAVALMDATYERVGNDESAKKGHFGVTGWQVKHLRFHGDKVTIKYVGKSGVKHEKVIDTAVAVRALRDAVKGKKPDDEVVECDADDVNDYLEPFGVSAKDIRGYHANAEMQARLKAIRAKGKKLPTDKKEREKILKAEFKEALEETADAVGHEPSTLRSQYLVPGLESSYLSDGDIPDRFDGGVS